MFSRRNFSQNRTTVFRIVFAVAGGARGGWQDVSEYEDRSDGNNVLASDGGGGGEGKGPHQPLKKSLDRECSFRGTETNLCKSHRSVNGFAENRVPVRTAQAPGT